ncbi:conjugal transfer protein, partial [Kingella kingae]|nr:conjugal transfer protein [Kingella kingae]
KEAEELIASMMSSLAPYEPTLLTAYQNQNGVLFSDVYRFFGSLINGQDEPVPLSFVDTYQTLGSAYLHFGSDIGEIRP